MLEAPVVMGNTSVFPRKRWPWGHELTRGCPRSGETRQAQGRFLRATCERLRCGLQCGVRAQGPSRGLPEQATPA